MSHEQRVAVIIGAGPAGLTAALELAMRTDIKPIVLEQSEEFGGISRTVCYRGNRMDIGGHRFFSKSDWVMAWWQALLPIAATDSHGGALEIAYQNKRRTIQTSPDAQAGGVEEVMLLRPRLSRIYYLRKFFDYPIKLNLKTIGNLGVVRMTRIALSYAYATIFPRKPEASLEDFLINRFGKELYRTFFRDYTEKVWGVPCREISAEWGAQRIKGLSICKALLHAVKSVIRVDRSASQRKVETSLIERFLYPKLGPGQMWSTAARKVQEYGGVVQTSRKVIAVKRVENRVVAVQLLDPKTNQVSELACDYCFSTMPIKELVLGLNPPAPHEVASVAESLPYRDFITVGLLVAKMKPNKQSSSTAANGMPPDNWIYIQEPDVKVGRLQIFNNWSSALVADPDKVWLGLEYFCAEGDELWSLSDDEMGRLAKSELEKIGLIDQSDVLDCTIIRVPKAYPAYFGAYAHFDRVRGYLDSIENLFLIGRNGMHRYNNQDHSMLTAKAAVDNIVSGRLDKSNIWEVNAEDEYHEQARSEKERSLPQRRAASAGA